MSYFLHTNDKFVKYEYFQEEKVKAYMSIGQTYLSLEATARRHSQENTCVRVSFLISCRTQPQKGKH